jgi:hypothetical protein
MVKKNRYYSNRIVLADIGECHMQCKKQRKITMKVCLSSTNKKCVSNSINLKQLYRQSRHANASEHGLKYLLFPAPSLTTIAFINREDP